MSERDATNPYDFYRPYQEGKHLLWLALSLMPLFAALVWLVSSYCDAGWPSDWFSRSGAVLVAAAIVGEVAVRNVGNSYRRAQPISTVFEGHKEISDLLNRRFYLAELAASLLVSFAALAGTFVWAYGDVDWNVQ